MSALAASRDWPEPVEVVNPGGRARLVLICEHASNHIPIEYAGLGLAPADLLRHIAWDIGAAEVTRRLAQRLDAPAFLGVYSRLLIDLNRPLEAQSSIPTRSEATDVPGNMHIDENERGRRAARIFDPFHRSVASHLESRSRAGRSTRIVTIHSFVPDFLGISRPWHAGVLFDKAEDFASAIIGAMRTDPTLKVEPNVPYQITADEDYSVPRHGDAQGVPAVLIEIRHDLLADAKGVRNWTDRLAKSISAATG